MRETALSGCLSLIFFIGDIGTGDEGRGQPATGCLFIFRVHVASCADHDIQDTVITHIVRPVCKQSQVHGIQRCHGPGGVPLDTGDLDQPVNGVASSPRWCSRATSAAYST